MAKQSDPYVPIECGLHSSYELAIMHKTRLQLGWLDKDGQNHNQSVMPLDIKVKSHQEFLIVQTTEGIQLEIRMDKITRSNIDEVNQA